MSIQYRRDIDGLRAIAVTLVVLFHLGICSSGYIGVDVFFVISGYLITGIVIKEREAGTFSFRDFYIRRIRRILPLSIIVVGISLLVGIQVMIPWDLKYLSESTFATMLFSNNILEIIQSGNYWGNQNDYRPLMHTWSLGVEEQFYLIYPVILYLLTGYRLSKRAVAFFVFVAFVLFVYIYIICPDNPSRFYAIQYRAYELLAGALSFFMSVRLRRVSWARLILLSGLIITILLDQGHISGDHRKLLVLFLVMGLLSLKPNDSADCVEPLKWGLPVGLGKLSFSIYMWHQVVFSYVRYMSGDKFDASAIIISLLLIFALSITSFYLIEKPLRNRAKIADVPAVTGLALLSVGVMAISFYLFSIGGVVRDVPELDIKKGNKVSLSDYTDSAYIFSRPFGSKKAKRVLVVGNSYARDWINVLIQSRYGDKIDIRYLNSLSDPQSIIDGLKQADFAFFAEMGDPIINYPEFARKIYIVGPKRLGSCNGCYLNIPLEYRYEFMPKSDPSILSVDKDMEKKHKGHYISLLSIVLAPNGRVRIFTPEKKLISSDTKHLTQAGASFISKELDGRLDAIFKSH